MKRTLLKSLVSLVCVLCGLLRVHGLTCPDPVGNTVTYKDVDVQLPKTKLETSYDSKGLQPFFNLANSFMNTVQPDSPADEFKNIDFDDVSNTFNKDKILDYETPIIVCAAFGVLFMLLMPLVGLFFCCCRCCGNCGGRMYHDAKDAERHTKCCICSLILLVITIFMLCGVLFMFVVNNHMHSSLKDAGKTYKQVIDDGFAMADAGVKGVDAITTEQLPCAVRLCKLDLTDDAIRDRVGNPLKTAVSTNVSTVLDQVITQSNNLDGLKMSLDKVKETSSVCKNLATDLQTEMTAGKNKLDQLVTDCRADAQALASGKCDDLEAIVIKTDVDLSSLPDIQSQIDNVQSIIDKNFKQSALDAKKVFEDIPDTVVNKTESVRVDIRKKIDDGEKTVQDEVNKVKDEINNNILSKRSDFDEYEKYVDQNGDYFKYENHRFHALIGIATIVAFIVILLFCGLALGAAGYKQDRLPSNRSNMATCGGNCLMAAVGFMFIFSGLLMLICWVWCAVGIHQHILCREMKDAELADQLVGDRIKIDGTIIRIKETLDNCRNNQPVFTALGGDKVFNLTDKLDIRQHAGDIDGEIDKLNVDLSDQKILTPEIQDALDDLINSGVENINYTDFFTKLSQKLVEVNLTYVMQQLEDIAVVLDTDAPTFANRVRDLKIDVEKVRDGTLKNLESNITKLTEEVTDVQNRSTGLKADAEQLLADMTSSDHFIRFETVTIIKQIVKDLSDRILGWLDQLTAHLVNQAKTNILKCGPIAGMYDGVYTYLCDNVGQNANGYWCALGWCLLFFIPAIIFAVKMAKFYRRMNFDSGYHSDISYPPYNDKIPLQERNPPCNPNVSAHTNPNLKRTADAPPPYTNTGYTQH